jgi:predicted RNA binding protein YcfA (HicA-like mRNA interferase family)
MCLVPPKLRELIADLKRAGFVQEPARGSHRKFRHPRGVTVILSGHGEGADALPYQERQVQRMIEESRK